MVYRNKEGYADPTAGAAIHEIAGYEMVGRIVLRDKDTGKEYR